MLRIIGKENNRFLLPSSAKAHSRKISFLLALYCVAFCTLAFGQIKTTSARASVLSGVVMSLNHVHDSSASYCNRSTLLFYNANTGEAASGVVNSTGFQTIKTFAPGAFAKGWTSVANADSLNLLMFYNSYTGAAAIGNSDRGNFTTTQTFNNFSKGWTNILYAGLTKGSTAEPLFYNSSSGAGALGYSPSIKTYPAGGFAPGWSHVVWNDSGMLFYDTYTGSGAVAVTFGSLPSQQAGVRTTKTFAAGAFAKSWTHVAATGATILFYDYASGSAAIGHLQPIAVASAADFVTDKTYPANGFAPHWTSIVSAANNTLLFYNADTGEGAIGNIANNAFTTTKVYPPNSFAHGFTNIVCTEDSPNGNGLH